MKFTLSKDAKPDQFIKFSRKAPIVGVVLLAAWCYLIYYLSLKSNFPKFIIWMNIGFIVLFLGILLRQIKGSLKGPIPFLIGVKGSTLLIPLNYSIKIPAPDLNLMFEIDAAEIQSIKITRRTHHIYHRRSGLHVFATEIQSHICLDIQLHDSLSADFYRQLEKVIRQEGFTGSPLYSPSARQIEYVMSDQGFKVEEIRQLLKERFSAAYDGAVLKSSVHLVPSKNPSTELIVDQAHRQFCLGDRILAGTMLDALLPDHANEIVARLRNQPLFEKYFTS